MRKYIRGEWVIDNTETHTLEYDHIWFNLNNVEKDKIITMFIQSIKNKTIKIIHIGDTCQKSNTFIDTKYSITYRYPCVLTEIEEEQLGYKNIDLSFCLKVTKFDINRNKYVNFIVYECTNEISESRLSIYNKLNRCIQSYFDEYKNNDLNYIYSEESNIDPLQPLLYYNKELKKLVKENETIKKQWKMLNETFNLFYKE